MTISMFQCLLIGLWTAFCLAGMLFGIYTNRCLVMAAGVGLILGDLPTGLAMGPRAVPCRLTQWGPALWEPSSPLP